MGACRSNELYEMKITHLQDLGSAFLVNVPNTKTKICRKFTVTDNFYKICKTYISLRPSHVTSDTFFLNYQNGKCTTQRIGINKFTKMGKDCFPQITESRTIFWAQFPQIFCNNTG
jgi:hypothetical protein